MAHIVASMIEIIERYLNEHLEQQQNRHDHHDFVDVDDGENIVRCFLDKASAFRDFLIHSNFIIGSKHMIRMVDAVNKAEDAVELKIITNCSVAAADDFIIHSQLDAVAEEFESIKQELLNRAEEDQVTLLWHVNQSSTFMKTKKKKKKKKRKVDDFVAIYEDDLQTLKSRILEPTRQLQIIPILGETMGMGKRTLALRLYNDSSVLGHFHVHACIGAFLEFDVKVILLNLLESLGNIITKEIRRKTVDEIGLILTNFLRYYKYFILIHNVSDEDIWSKLRRFFPEDGCGSRILYTGIGEEEDDDDDKGKASKYGGEPHRMRYLTDGESWLLFCHMVFGQDHCPVHELEPMAKVIVGDCRGHTQVVALIAGLLATSEMNPSFWEIVSLLLNVSLEGEEDQGTKMIRVFGSIYMHLPYYLKPCLLYILAFRECCDIKASDILKLWIAEGFVKDSAGNTLENIARDYLDILIDKSLLHLIRQDAAGRVKAFHIQPALRISYMFLANEEKFLWSKDFWSIDDRDNINDIRRVSGSKLLQPSDGIEISSRARSFLSTGHASPPPSHVFVGLELLRILDVYQLELFQFPAEILHLFLLRYLAFSCHSNTPASISIFWNLQTLIIRRLPSIRAFSLPIQLLEMAQLTHVKCKETFVWRYPQNRKEFLHIKLQTLSNMQLFGLSNEFFEQIPNIKKLGIFCNIAMHYVLDLGCLDKLEILRCSTDWSLASKNFLSNIKFPSTLRKVTLTKCRIPPEFMKVVGALSSLEDLKLQKCDFLVMESGPTEPEWEPAEGEFRRLISLVMKDLDLVHWKAHASHFPRLRQLIVFNCYAMLGLPEDIGDIQTLELIHVNKHSPSVVASAMKIKEKHCGNLILEVQITKS